MICLGRIVASLSEKSVKFSPRQDRPAAPPSALPCLRSSSQHRRLCVPKRRLLHVLILKTLWVGPSELKSGAGPEHQHFNRLPGLLRSAVRDSVLPSLWEQNTWGEPGPRELRISPAMRCICGSGACGLLGFTCFLSLCCSEPPPLPGPGAALLSLEFQGPDTFFFSLCIRPVCSPLACSNPPALISSLPPSLSPGPRSTSSLLLGPNPFQDADPCILW